MLRTLGRGLKPIVLLDRRTPDRLPFAVDTHHPVGGAHYQKIVVIDDCRAFADGIHVTADRWDPSDHADGNPHRRPPVDGRPEGRPTGPWHDATSIMIGVLFVGQRLQLLDRGASQTARDFASRSGAAPARSRSDGAAAMVSEGRHATYAHGCKRLGTRQARGARARAHRPYAAADAETRELALQPVAPSGRPAR